MGERRIVQIMANGCFDLIHAGHILFFKKLKEEFPNSHIAVLLNTDESVKRLKGDKRPIYPLEERIVILSAITYIDSISIFSTEEQLLKWIKRHKPDYIAKASEYMGRDITGRDEAKIHFVEYQKGLSTTNILERIIERYCEENEFENQMEEMKQQSEDNFWNNFNKEE